MLQFSLFGFPVKIHWLFGVIAFLISGGLGMQSSHEWPRIFTAMVVVFISILIHELGHAIAARFFGQRPGILFHGLGGLTFFQGKALGRVEHFLVVAAGPAATFFLILGFVVLGPFKDLSPLLPKSIEFGIVMNTFWLVVNLMPVLPLDGGQMLRDILGPKRERIACIVGAVFGTLIAVYALMGQAWFLAIVMGFLAYSNYVGSTQLQGGVTQVR
ncbi:MAG: M50 family metallopeptidase [Verrucomicrobiota bacterium]